MTKQDDKLANLNLRNVAGEVIHHRMGTIVHDYLV